MYYVYYYYGLLPLAGIPSRHTSASKVLRQETIQVQQGATSQDPSAPGFRVKHIIMVVQMHSQPFGIPLKLWLTLL